MTQNPHPREATKTRATVVGGIAVGVVLMILAFFFLPRWAVRTRSCASTVPTSQLGVQCLTAVQRLQAESEERTAGVGALGGLAFLIGIYFTWRQVRLGRDQLALAGRQLTQSQEVTRATLASTQHLAETGQAHDRDMAATARRQERLGPTYVDALAAAIAVTETRSIETRETYRQAFRIAQGPLAPVPLPPHPGEQELMLLDARVQAHGSERMVKLFRDFLIEQTRVWQAVHRWNEDRVQLAQQAGTTGASDLGRARPPRPSAETLIALRDEMRAVLRYELGTDERPGQVALEVIAPPEPAPASQ